MSPETIPNCPNCKHTIEENFCTSCGQKKFKRIDRKYIWDEIQYTVLHTNKGFLYSVKKILRNPGKTAREFLDGNRVNHYKPILLVFVLSGISSFISFKVLNLADIMKEFYAVQNKDSEMMQNYMTFVSSYNSIMMLLLIPLYSIFTRLAFRKSGQNYYEHVVMNAFGQSFYTLITILILYPIYFIFRHDVGFILQLSSYSMLVLPIIMVVFYKGFYKEKSLFNIILRVIAIIVMFMLFFIVIVIAASFLATMLMGPEAMMKYMQPHK